MSLSPDLAAKIEHWPPARLKRYARNAKRHPPRQVAELAASIARFGFNDPIAVRGEEIVAGHGRLDAANLLELELVPVIVLDHLSEDEARAYRLASNRLAELGETDAAMLAEELEAAIDAGFEGEALGFTDAELAALLKSVEDLDTASTGDGYEPGPEHADEPETVPAEPAEPAIASTGDGDDEPDPDKGVDLAARYQKHGPPITRAGDLWILGRHRLLCADARNAESSARLAAGAKFEILMTDPPYCSGGFQEAGKTAGTFGDIAADNLSTRGYQALLREVFTAAGPQTAYVFTDWRMWIPLYDVVESSGLAVRSMIVWNKRTPGLGSLWRTQHEIVMYASRGGHKRQKGIPAFGNVIDAARTGNHHHYTEKPVELLERLIRGDEPSGRRGAIVDPFCGSGSTLLACEHTDRTGYGSEVEPAWVDAAVRRWQEDTGSLARLEADGRTFDDVAGERRAAPAE